MSAYWAHFRTSVREDVRYFFSDSILGSLGAIGFIGLALLFYSASGQTLFFNRFTWQMMGWYLIITEMLVQNQGNTIRKFNDEIQNGEIISRMTKPYHYPLAMLSTYMGSVLVECTAILLLAIPFGLAVSGTSALTWYGIIFGLLAIILAFLIDFAICTSIGLIAFWTEDAKPYVWIYGKIIFIFGGLLFPLEVYPPMLRAISSYLPPAFLLYYPATLIVDFSWALLLKVLIGQIAHLILFSIIAMIMYRTSMRKVSINGG